MNWNKYDPEDPDAIARGIGIRVMVWTIVFLVFVGLIGDIPELNGEAPVE